MRSFGSLEVAIKAHACVMGHQEEPSDIALAFTVWMLIFIIGKVLLNGL